MKIADTQANLDEIKCSLDRVQQWVESHNYRAYEPFDGLSSWARPLTFEQSLCAADPPTDDPAISD